MIFWHTDNIICKKVAEAVHASGVNVRHINDFNPRATKDHVFYGILRGAGNAIKLCEHLGINYYYIDNGYFDAKYVNEMGYKDLSGSYRVCKNTLIDPFTGDFDFYDVRDAYNILLIPPSEYSAFMHNTTPEDWIASLSEDICKPWKIRKKGDKTPLDKDIMEHDSVIAFNSMSVMRAVELGKPAWAKYGCFKNMGHYRWPSVHDFYQRKNYTLQQIAGGSWKS